MQCCVRTCQGKKRTKEKFIFVIVKSCSAVTVLLDENTNEAAPRTAGWGGGKTSQDAQKTKTGNLARREREQYTKQRKAFRY